MSEKIERLTKEERELYEYLKEKREYWYKISDSEDCTVHDEINYAKYNILYNEFCVNKKLLTFNSDIDFCIKSANRSRLVLGVYLLYTGEEDVKTCDYSKNNLIDEVLNVYKMIESEKYKNELSNI